MLRLEEIVLTLHYEFIKTINVYLTHFCYKKMFYSSSLFGCSANIMASDSKRNQKAKFELQACSLLHKYSWGKLCIHHFFNPHTLTLICLGHIRPAHNIFTIDLSTAATCASP